MTNVSRSDHAASAAGDKSRDAPTNTPSDSVGAMDWTSEALEVLRNINRFNTLGPGMDARIEALLASSPSPRGRGAESQMREALERIVATYRDGANTGDRHAACVEIAQAALSTLSEGSGRAEGPLAEAAMSRAHDHWSGPGTIGAQNADRNMRQIWAAMLSATPALAASPPSPTREIGAETEAVITRDGYHLNIKWTKFGRDYKVRVYEPQMMYLSPALADVLALTYEAAASPPRGSGEQLDELAKHTNWELSFGYPDEEAEGEWRVHCVTGGRSDREWTLIGSGQTPALALKQAMLSALPALPVGGEGQ